MEITEIRIKLMEGSEDRLRAFCSITVDQSFVIRDLKIIDGAHGPFVAMPSRKLTGHCSKCGAKNHLRAAFCNTCGARLHGMHSSVDSPQKLYADVAHPINSECREMIQDAVIAEFEAELSRSRQPGYRSRYDDDFDAGDYDEADYVSGEESTAKEEPVEEGFGAGIVEEPPPVVERTIENDGQRTIARGHSGQSAESVPKPHFNDNRGGSRGSSVTTAPPSGYGTAGQDPDDEDDAADSFGLGIFDD
ncbi:MAG: SpoVG family protein [Planctomycetota bacterium]